MPAKISVITPVYNREKMIERCVNSVLAQSYQNFEIIIVDDGSTDNTVEVCKGLCERDPRVKLFLGEHKGPSAARNRALKEASGDYLFFLDSDDIIHERMLEVLVGAAERYNAGIAASDIRYVRFESEDKLSELLKTDDEGNVQFKTNSQAVHAAFTSRSPINLIGGVMMKKDLVGNNLFNTDLFIGEDFYFIYENLIKGTDVVFLEPRWYICVKNSGSISYNYHFSAFYSRFRRRELVWENEERLGRYEYAGLQKTGAVGVFYMCVDKNKPYSKDAQKMRSFMRKYKKVLFGALSLKEKIIFSIALYLPLLYTLLQKIRNA